MNAGHSNISTLGKVVDFLDSRRRPVKAEDRKPGPYPYYGANGQQGTIDGFLFDEPLVLLAEDGGHFFEPSRGIAYKVTGKTWVNNHAHVLRPKPAIDIDYLCLALKHLDVSKYLTGTTRAKLTKAGASRIEIPLPPLAEQKRIGAILDAADALRAKRRETLAQLDTLLQSTFLDMFGDPVTNPKGWKLSTVGNIASRVTDGDHHTPKRSQSGIKLLSARNILHGEIDLTNTDFVEQEEYERMIKRCHPEREDILISCSGSIGRVARITFKEPVVLVRSAALVKPNKSLIHPIFLENFLKTPQLHRKMVQSAKSSSQANLFQKPIRDLSTFLPPLPLQRRFATIVESVEQQKSRLGAHLAELDTLFASLQDRAFKGAL